MATYIFRRVLPPYVQGFVVKLSKCTMFSRTGWYPSRYGALQALFGYIPKLDITVSFGSEHCAL